jgi:hypothetical protein
MLHMTMLLDLAARSDDNKYMTQLQRVQRDEVPLHRASFDEFRSHRLNVIQRHRFRNELYGNWYDPRFLRQVVDLARDNYIGGGRVLNCGGLNRACSGDRENYLAWNECGSWRHAWDSCFDNYLGSIQSALNKMGTTVTRLEGMRP